MAHSSLRHSRLLTLRTRAWWQSEQSEQSEWRREQTMASPENLGSLYFSAAAWALETVGLEMMIGLALSKARLTHS